jgi:hypothetical protein
MDTARGNEGDLPGRGGLCFQLIVLTEIPGRIWTLLGENKAIYRHP